MGVILMRENGQLMQTSTSTSKNIPALVSLPDALRDFHKHLPLAGDPPNALLSLPDDLLLYLIGAIRNTPQSPPDLSVEEWHNFFTLIRPHMIFPLITFYLRTWPEDCQPPQEKIVSPDGRMNFPQNSCMPETYFGLWESTDTVSSGESRSAAILRLFSGSSRRARRSKFIE